MERDEAISSLHRLAGLMQLQGKSDHATRLHRRAVLAEVTPSLASGATLLSRSGNPDGTNLEEQYGVQVDIRDDRVMPPAVAALVDLAELHASRQQFLESIRVMERTLDIEEKRIGALDPRLAPHLLRLAYYVEMNGNVHEANSIRDRAIHITNEEAPQRRSGGGRASMSPQGLGGRRH